MPLLRRASLSLPIFLVALGTINATAQKTFGVVSIRENLSPGGPQSYGPTPDGYRMVNLPLTLPILTAYVQSGSGAMFSPDNIVGIQDVLMGMGRYDIDARVSEADRAAWQDPKQQPEMLREMLQAMLAERFHLRVHREIKQQNIYLLQVAKGGAKLQGTKPDDPHPGTMALPGGGRIGPSPDNMFHFYDMSMPVLATTISPYAGRAVRDDTGLTGRYDFTFDKPSFATNTLTNPSADVGPSISSVLAGFGLRLEPAKGDVETLVIDQIEKPTAN